MSTTFKLATLLMIGAALAATPVLAAASTAGNRGPAEKPVTRDAPIILPGAITPKLTPKVDGSATRGLFDIDPAAALASLGTVTLSRDGSTAETEASDALRGIFEISVKGHKPA